MANPRKPKKDINKASSSSSWVVVRTILTFKHHQQQPQQHKVITKQEEQPLHPNQQHHHLRPPSKQRRNPVPVPIPDEQQPITKNKKMRCSGSLCSNTKVVLVVPNTTTSSPVTHKRGPRKSPPTEPAVVGNGGALTSTMSSSSLLSSSSASSNSRSSRRIPFGRLSGCYECRMVVDPASGLSGDLSSSSSVRSTICCCPDCGEVFMKSETLELHQAVRHAVTELCPGDTSKSVVEIIFQSSWLKKQSPTCEILRILKVHNTPGTISGFEQHRDSIKSRATKKNPRCLADGNELLRFYCTTLACPLGLNGSTNLCCLGLQRSPCGVCDIIRNGFKPSDKGVMTTATSGKAHDKAGPIGDRERAMLVCRVIAGRVGKRVEGAVTDGEEGRGGEECEHDSVAKAGEGGGFGSSNIMDELIVFNPKAFLPCFVVIYKLN
ncbi:hypothetical protein MLD38_033985 [Melastoma candidum]|uniref:Uncharacterized protein n=1 Tax=Melastoma candidum TaxID=119954 RepID=A0ACB9M905_9MYRT|nr:hypothetical protein MLD38_033985 [Melastoma candidum]